MKIQREEKRPPVRFVDRLAGSLAVKLAVLALAFIAGALVYRSGILRPVTLQLRQLITGESLATPGPWQQEIEQSVEDELRLYQNNGLPTLYIDLKFEYYQQLLEKRAEAVDLGILLTTDADFVPCDVQLQDGPKLAAEMRLKGDWTDHLQGDKWSFRIKLKDDGEILQFRQFSIQTPETRNYLNEWAFHKNLIAEGILATRYEFVNVLLNGKLLGIYAIEEHFAPELLESQGRRQGVIIRFNEDLLWENRAVFLGADLTVDQGGLMVTDLQSSEIDAFQPSRIASDPVLSAEAETARDLLRAFQSGERPASEVFDVGLMGRYFALTDLWGAEHAMYWHNWRFYYNPFTGLLEPIGFDAQPLGDDGYAPISYSLIHSGMFEDAQIRSAYASELKRFTDPAYVQSVVTSLGPEADRLAAALEIEYPDEAVAVKWNQLWNRRQGLELELQPPATVRGAYQAVGVLPGDARPASLQVDLVNLMILPVEVLRLEVGGEAILPSGVETVLAPVIDPQTATFDPVRLTVPLVDRSAWQGKDPPEIAVVTRLAGSSDEVRVVLTGTTTPEGLLVGPLPANPALDEVVARHPFLSPSPDGRAVLVAPGVWDVRGDLVLPEGLGLDVGPGATLRFEAGAILLARGPVNLLGSAGAPVVLTAQADGWGGVVVLAASQDSLWKYAIVEKTAGVQRDGWILTGGITFYQSPIRLDHVLLGNNQTEDAINVVHSRFAFIDSEFANTPSDAFDADFSEGEISGSYFHDIGGDAVDVSGTQATVADTRIERITDKGVSVGEQSTVTLRGVRMDTVGIGLASKDLSKAYLYDTQISHAEFAALAAYVKKPVYGPASIEAPDLIVIDSAREAIVQVGSTISLRGQAVPAVELDVDRLYEEGVLGN